MSKRKVIIDHRTFSYIGPASKIFECLEYFHENNYEVKLIKKDWKLYTPGLNFSSANPDEHLNDILDNLILPTFKNVDLIKPKKNNLLRKIEPYIFPLIKRDYLINFDFSKAFLEKESLKLFFSEQKEKLLLNKNLKNFLKYFFFIIYFYLSAKKNIKSKGFRYKLNSHVNTERVASFIKKHKKPGVKKILISVSWDESLKFESHNDRTIAGPRFKKNHDEEFENLKKFISDLDQYALETKKIEFILASKKAVDWEKFLKSDFIDLRNFEEQGFTLSQSIYIAQELTDVSINWPSTYSIWITNCKNILHLTWLDNKDTAKWARNNYQKKSANSLLKTLNLI